MFARLIDGGPRFSSSPHEPSLPPVSSLEEINLLDPELYHRGDPHAAWRLLRARAPVFWHEKGSPGTEGKGFWVLSCYDDAAVAYRDSSVFSSETGPFLDLETEAMPRKMLASIDGEKHRLNRRIVAPLFTPGSLNKWSDSILSTVNVLLDAASRNSTCDFLSDIAAKLPIIATCNLLGVAPDEADSLAKLLIAADPESSETLQKFNEATIAFFDAVAIERRRTSSQDSIVGIVAHARRDGELLEREEISHLLWNLFFGGIDSTAHAATGGLLAFFHHPDQLDILRGDPHLVRAALDEIFRWTSISHANKRIVTRDVVIRETRIKQGDYVSMWSPSANRDETAFEDPYRFDVRRTMTRPIMSFGGGGPHQCLGQFFARLELRILFEQILSRFPDVRQAGPAVRAKHFTVITAAFKSLPISLRQ